MFPIYAYQEQLSRRERWISGNLETSYNSPAPPIRQKNGERERRRTGRINSRFGSTSYRECDSGFSSKVSWSRGSRRYWIQPCRIGKWLKSSAPSVTDGKKSRLASKTHFRFTILDCGFSIWLIWPWLNAPQYHLPELPRLNTLRCPSELNRASGA